MNNIKLSILIPSYNVSQYIVECLDSISNQINNKCEVILYDDGSFDGTVDKIRLHGIFTNSGFRLINAKKNYGISIARNILIEQCVGEYIWFVDSDDVILDNSIHEILNCIEQFQPELLFFDYYIWSGDNFSSIKNINSIRISFDGKYGFHRNQDGFLYNATIKSTKLHLWTKVYKRSLFKDGTEFPTGKIFEDVTVVPLLSAYAETAFYLNKPLVAYRAREGSIVASLNFTKEVECLQATNEMKKRYEKYVGCMSKKSHLVTTFLATWQLRHIIKTLSKCPNKQMRIFLIEQCLSEFKKIHGKSIIYGLYASLCEGGFFHFLHFSKRLMQAYCMCLFKK
ncbi:glycosyltransferase family 2 protein [Brucellaceae bacterium C25G]